MKKRILAAFLLAGALIVTPMGGDLLSAVATASSNSTVSSDVTSLIGNVTTSNAKAVADLVRTYDTRAMGEAMVSGETSLVAKVAELEAAYKEALGIPDTKVAVSGVEGVDASSVKVLGAALNAGTEGASLSISASEQSVNVPSGYTNAHVLEISMAGLNTGRTMPMMITMPVPSGIDINRVAVIHYVTRSRWDSDTNTSIKEIVPEALTTANNGDGTISFFVTSFSTFVFAESDGASSDSDGDSEEEGSGSASDSQDDIANLIINANGGDVIKVTGVTALSNGVMKELLKKGNVTLVMEYTYEGVNYVVTIPAGAAENNDIPWYGPLYLSSHYGSGAPAVKGAGGASYTVQSGDTMSKIARANGMTLSQLAAKNPQVKDIDFITVGQKINLN